MSKIQRALVSVSDKTNLVSFCRFLREIGVEIISTGGTARVLQESGIPITPIDEWTGFPEMLDGRVKTLHPRVHGALLGLRDKPEHVRTMEEHDIRPIDLVVVNLYPFETVSNREGSSFEEVIENIDIGGPSMVRSAAKNFRFVGIVTHPSQYGPVMKELKEHHGELSPEMKKSLSQQAFMLTSRYDNLISTYLKYGKPGSGEFPERLTIESWKLMDLRYGENPHQCAAFYRTGDEVTEPAIPNASRLQGKELSFNNILDFDGALSCIKEFEDPVCVVVKHTNPSGVAAGNDPLSAFERAWAGDPVSAFGSVIAFNREVDADTARMITRYFVEGVIAPEYTQEAREIFAAKKNLRLLLLPSLARWASGERDRMTPDRFDIKKEKIEEFETATENAPSREELNDLLFAWKVVKHVKSNAIVYVKNRATIGIGAGQMSRVDSARIGVQKAVTDLKGAVMASDAFFPFRDAVDSAAEAGIRAIVQPGGSIRDEEVVRAANEHGIAMVFTRTRHFRH
jgi:phosphoribosylaminoimidazolecarboxamide formyltransferase/IMP cyclohydrolase